MLLNLLGIAYDPSEHWANLPADKLLEMGRYAFLGEDKLKAVHEVLHKYGLREGQSWPPEMRQELASLLTSDEMHELELRDSNTANSVRSKFGSWEITEAEYRRLYALRKSYEEAQGEYDPDDPEKMKRRNEARQALNSAYRQELGETRYNELFKQRDYSYQALNQLASSHNVAPSTVEQAYATQRIAMDQISKVFNDATLSPEIRKETLAALNGELERELQKLIGQTAYHHFRQSN